MVITNFKRLIAQNCENTAPVYYRDESSWCSANISDLDEILEVPASCGIKFGRLSIRCLSGVCVSCRRESHKYTNSADEAKQGGRTKESVGNSGLDVYLNTWVFDRNTGRDQKAECAKVNDFARTLSRIISGGSDEAFCKENPSYCQR
jgi:hypothetical protein